MQEQERTSTGFTVAKLLIASGLIIAAGAAAYSLIPEKTEGFCTTNEPSYTQCAHEAWLAKTFPSLFENAWTLLEACKDKLCPPTILTETCTKFFGFFYSGKAGPAINALVEQADSLKQCFPEPFQFR